MNSFKSFEEFVGPMGISGTSGSMGVSGTSGSMGVPGTSGFGYSSSCGYSGSSPLRSVFDTSVTYSDTALTYSTSESKLPILRDLVLIPISKKPIKIQNSGLYGVYDNLKFHMLYE